MLLQLTNANGMISLDFRGKSWLICVCFDIIEELRGVRVVISAFMAWEIFLGERDKKWQFQFYQLNAVSRGIQSGGKCLNGVLFAITSNNRAFRANNCVAVAFFTV